MSISFSTEDNGLGRSVSCAALFRFDFLTSRREEAQALWSYRGVCLRETV